MGNLSGRISKSNHPERSFRSLCSQIQSMYLLVLELENKNRNKTMFRNRLIYCWYLEALIPHSSEYQNTLGLIHVTENLSIIHHD